MWVLIVVPSEKAEVEGSKVNFFSITGLERSFDVESNSVSVVGQCGVSTTRSKKG